MGKMIFAILIICMATLPVFAEDNFETVQQSAEPQDTPDMITVETPPNPADVALNDGWPEVLYPPNPGSNK